MLGAEMAKSLVTLVKICVANTMQDPLPDPYFYHDLVYLSQSIPTIINGRYHRYFTKSFDVVTTDLYFPYFVVCCTYMRLRQLSPGKFSCS